jgi:hypothetical protein
MGETGKFAALLLVISSRSTSRPAAQSAMRSALCESIIDNPVGMGYKTNFILCYGCQGTGSLSFL